MAEDANVTSLIRQMAGLNAMLTEVMAEKAELKKEKDDLAR
ncbi:MAG: hypothetical protein P4L50_10195 [Anaerolineaceae bacterium]|nr:hypothetical protein [Anaerolineaceae bacterium]